MERRHLRHRGGGAVHRRDVRRRAPDRGRRLRRLGERAAERDLERQLRRRRLRGPRRDRDRRRRLLGAGRAHPRGGDARRGARHPADHGAEQPRRGGRGAGPRAAPRLRQRGRRRDARLPLRRRAARRGAAGPGVARRLLQRGRLAADARAVPVAARARRPGGGTADRPCHQPRDGRGALAREQAPRRPRRPRRDQARGDGDRGHHRPEARGARAAAARARRPGALVLAQLRAHAAGGRRPRRALARRLVRREHARPARPDRAGRGGPQRPGEGRVRPQLQPALPEPHERRGWLGAGAARRPLAADPRDPRRAARGGGPGSRAARAAAQHRHALGDQRADDGGVGEADRRHLASSTPSPAGSSPRASSSCARSSGGGRGSRSRTPASTPSAR